MSDNEDKSFEELVMLSFPNNLNINLREKLCNTTSNLIASYINNYSTHLEYTNELDKHIEFTADQTLNNFTYFTLPNLEPKKFFLEKKIERIETDIKKKKMVREDNCRIGIGRNFMNHYLKNLIEEMKNECNCILHFEYFPEKFIFQSVKKSNIHYLEYTLEELLENKNLYEKKDPRDYYSINLKVINELKSEKNKCIMEKYGYDKILKMKYRELYKEYLKSYDCEQKMNELIKKERNETKKIEKWFKEFVERFKKK